MKRDILPNNKWILYSALFGVLGFSISGVNKNYLESQAHFSSGSPVDVQAGSSGKPVQSTAVKARILNKGSQASAGNTTANTDATAPSTKPQAKPATKPTAADTTHSHDPSEVPDMAPPADISLEETEPTAEAAPVPTKKGATDSRSTRQAPAEQRSQREPRDEATVALNEMDPNKISEKPLVKTFKAKGGNYRLTVYKLDGKIVANYYKISTEASTCSDCERIVEAKAFPETSTYADIEAKLQEQINGSNVPSNQLAQKSKKLETHDEDAELDNEEQSKGEIALQKILDDCEKDKLRSIGRREDDDKIASAAELKETKCIASKFIAKLDRKLEKTKKVGKNKKRSDKYDITAEEAEAFFEEHLKTKLMDMLTLDLSEVDSFRDAKSEKSEQSKQRNEAIKIAKMLMDKIGYKYSELKVEAKNLYKEALAENAKSAILNTTKAQQESKAGRLDNANLYSMLALTNKGFLGELNEKMATQLLQGLKTGAKEDTVDRDVYSVLMDELAKTHDVYRNSLITDDLSKLGINTSSLANGTVAIVLDRNNLRGSNSGDGTRTTGINPVVIINGQPQNTNSTNNGTGIREFVRPDGARSTINSGTINTGTSNSRAGLVPRGG